MYAEYRGFTSSAADRPPWASIETAAHPEPEPFNWLLTCIVMGGLIALLLATSGCARTNATKLEAAPPAPVIAKVAIPVPCQIEQVPMPAYPGDLIRKGDDVYTLARLAMADRRTRIAERDRLRAANNSPCPEVSDQ